MKTKAIITLSEDDYFLLVWLLGVGAGQALKSGDRNQAMKFKNLYIKISESVTFVTFPKDHEKKKT